MSHNHVNYQARLDFIQQLIRGRFSLEEDADIIPIQYDPECPFKYNNFIYRISLPSPIGTHDATKDQALQPGCVTIPDGTRELVIRLTNPSADGMHSHTRVENEVAIISLASAALHDFSPAVVPSVYAWNSAAEKSSQGWILQELMPGSPVDESFGAMDLQQKQEIMAQMARLLKALQVYQIPESITGFGRLTFDGTGCIVSVAMATVGSGPWLSYEAFFKTRLEIAFQEADANSYIQGWRANGVRERLDAFVERGTSALFEDLDSKYDKAIVHADFTTNNLLFDPVTRRITALLDYDFACILHPSYEFLCSFGGFGKLGGWSSDENSEQAALRKAKIQGSPSPLPPSTKDGVEWDVAKAWEEEMKKLDVKRPSIIKGIDKVADADSILQAVLPWRVSNADILRLQSEETILRCRDENEQELIRMLCRLGF